MSTLSDFVFVIVDTNDSGIRNKILEHGGTVLMKYVKKVKYAILDCGEDNLTKDVSKKVSFFHIHSMIRLKAIRRRTSLL